MDPDGPVRAAPVPSSAARKSLPLYASVRLSGSVDPYLSSEPYDWRQLHPGSVDIQSPGSVTGTHLFATGTLEIFQDLSGYCQHWGSCQHCTPMGNTGSTSCSVSEGELRTPEIGATNVFEFIDSADENINRLGDAFSPEVLDAFLNSADNIDIEGDEQPKIDDAVRACSPDDGVCLVEHKEVVGECEDLSDPLSCKVKCESTSDRASVFSEEPCMDSKLSLDVGPEEVFCAEEHVAAKPKLDLASLLDSPPATDVIGTPEVLQLLYEADVQYSWLRPEDSAEVPVSLLIEEPQQSLSPGKSTALLENTTDSVDVTLARNEEVVRPARKISRKRKTVDLVAASSAKASSTAEEACSPVQTKRTRRVREAEVPCSGRGPAVGRRARCSVSSEEDICQKYRELRDRNNEASRRSRRNRKAQDEEMRQSAEHLEQENERLRIKVEEMEKLRDKVKEALLRIVKGSSQ